jgi:hypothetical protein
MNSDSNIYPNDIHLRGKFPDWKNRKNFYISDSIIGKMYREISEKIEDLLNSTRKTVSLHIPHAISKMLMEVKQDSISTLKEYAMESIEKYIKERSKQYYAKKDKNCFFYWRQKYLKDERENYIYNKKLDRDRISLVNAAIIYEQCFYFEQNDPSCNACEYAWGVCLNELLEIFAGKNSLNVACESQCYVLKR